VIYYNKEKLKLELSKGKVDDIVEYLYLVKVVFTESLMKKIQQAYNTWLKTENDWLQGVINHDKYSIYINTVNKDCLEIVDEIFEDYSDEEFLKVIDFCLAFNMGVEAYTRENWNKALESFVDAEYKYIDKFKAVKFELSTKKFITELNIVFNDHLAKYKEHLASANQYKYFDFSNIYLSEIFNRHPYKNKILIYENSLQFIFLLNGDYEINKIDRSYRKIKVPKLDSISDRVNYGVSEADLSVKILPFSNNVPIENIFSFEKINEIQPLKIKNTKNDLSYFIINEIEDKRCAPCNGRGYIRCDCYEGLVMCIRCDGLKDIDCYLCNGDKKTVCRNCKRKTKTCTDCCGDKNINCSTCSNSRLMRDDCDKCNNTGEISCDNCDINGKRPCSSCDGNGKKECYKCDGKGENKCDVCSATGGFFTIPFIQTTKSSSIHNFSLEYNPESESIVSIPEILHSNFKKIMSSESLVPVYTFYRTDGYEVEFSGDKFQQSVSSKYRNIESLNVKNIYPLMIGETIDYQILPCFKVKYSFIFDNSKEYNLYIPMKNYEVFDLIFEKEPELDNLKYRNNFKINLGRAFSSKKQLNIDDSFKEIFLLAYFAKKDKILDKYEKKILSDKITASFTDYSKKNQLQLLDIINGNNEMNLNKYNFKFSTKERGQTAVNNLKTSLKNLGSNISLVDMEESIKANSSKRVNYIMNFINTPFVSLPILFFVLIFLAVIVITIFL